MIQGDYIYCGPIQVSKALAVTEHFVEVPNNYSITCKSPVSLR